MILNLTRTRIAGADPQAAFEWEKRVAKRDNSLVRLNDNIMKTVQPVTIQEMVEEDL